MQWKPLKGNLRRKLAKFKDGQRWNPSIHTSTTYYWICFERWDIALVRGWWNTLVLRDRGEVCGHWLRIWILMIMERKERL